MGKDGVHSQRNTTMAVQGKPQSTRQANKDTGGLVFLLVIYSAFAAFLWYIMVRILVRTRVYEESLFYVGLGCILACYGPALLLAKLRPLIGKDAAKMGGALGIMLSLAGMMVVEQALGSRLHATGVFVLTYFLIPISGGVAAFGVILSRRRSR